MSEIKRKRWASFCRKFNANNLYRKATVTVSNGTDEGRTVIHDAPFLGIAITKAGRLIDGIDVFSGQYDPEKLSKPMVSLKRPVRIDTQQDDSGLDTLIAMQFDDGSTVSIELSGEKDAPSQYQSLVEKIAYSLAEQRGFEPGNDLGDWLEAERRVKQTQVELS